MSTSHSIHLGFLLQYTTFTNYFYCKGHIQMRSNDSTIEVEAEEIE